MGFFATAALPWGVVGPVDFWQFRRFAAICALVAMIAPPNLRLTTDWFCLTVIIPTSLFIVK